MPNCKRDKTYSCMISPRKKELKCCKRGKKIQSLFLELKQHHLLDVSPPLSSTQKYLHKIWTGWLEISCTQQLITKYPLEVLTASAVEVEREVDSEIRFSRGCLFQNGFFCVRVDDQMCLVGRCSKTCPLSGGGSKELTKMVLFSS